MKVYLIGLPGCGKSTLGRQLARLLNTVFIDLDTEIEKSVSLPVRDIFKQYGELFFRKHESEMLQGITESHADFVMATGGGTPVFIDNMSFMNANGTTIFLDVPLPEIIERMAASNKEERPLLSALAPHELKDKIELLYIQRVEHYNQAWIKLSGTMQAEDIFNALKS